MISSCAPMDLGVPTRPRCRYLSTSVIARRVGVTARTVRLWAECGELPAIKVGRQWRIDENHFEVWLSCSCENQLSRKIAEIREAEETNTERFGP